MGGARICLVFVLAGFERTCGFVYSCVLVPFLIKESTVVNFVSRFELVSLTRLRWRSGTAERFLNFVLRQSGFRPQGAKRSRQNEA
uniref:Secreted protein n=1 Tax=Rhipicephalus appendiculatus TaxID=34631 RepID=A0A131YVG2_RHIAP